MASPVNPTMDPVLDPKLAADLLKYEEAQAAYQKKWEELRKQAMAAGIIANPLVYCQMLMLGMTDVMGDDLGGVAAMENIQSDLRSGVTGIQNGFNQGGTANSKDMQKILDYFNGLMAFFDSNPKSVGADTVKILKDALDSIKKQFGGSWGDANKMSATWGNWEKEYGKGTVPPQIGAIQSALQTGNQALSSLATTTNAIMQTKVETLKQILGIVNDLSKAFIQYESNIVRKLANQ